MPKTITTLNDKNLAEGLRHLSKKDPDLANVYKCLGKPPMWLRKPSFATLVHIILEQQVSLASAKAAFEKLKKEVKPLTPKNFLKLDDAEIKRIGFSRQKTSYVRGLATAIIKKDLDLKSLAKLSDDDVRNELMKLKGIGIWTANVYLMMALGRLDVWAKGDIALAAAAQSIKGLDKCPSQDELVNIAEDWKPWRSVAARLLWHHYLSQ